MRAPAVPQAVQIRVPEPLFCRHCVPDCVPGHVYVIPPSPVVPEMTTPFEMLRPPANVEEADAESPVNVEKPPNVDPPANVLVPVLVMLRSPEDKIFPPVIVRPAELAKPPVEIPPTNVEVAVDVALTNPNPGEVEALITPLLKEIKYWPERLDVETFWLKVFQSVERRNPFVAVLEVEIANTPLFES